MKTIKYTPKNTPSGVYARKKTNQLIGIEFSNSGRIRINGKTSEFIKIGANSKLCFHQSKKDKNVWFIDTCSTGFPLKMQGNYLAFNRANLIKIILESKGMRFCDIMDISFEIECQIVNGVSRYAITDKTYNSYTTADLHKRIDESLQRR